MSVTVRIPTPLRKLTQNEPEVEVSGNNIESLIDNLVTKTAGDFR